LLLLLLCAFSAFCALRSLSRQIGSSGAGRKWLVLAGCGAGLLALGSRFLVAEGRVSWAPYADQWNAEISGIVAPLVHGTLGWRELVAGNNEHRVFLTRVLSLGVVLANGGWDNRALVIANYLLEAVMVAWVCTLAWGALGWARGSYVCAVALLPMFLVCDWETLVSSNQAQFVFMAFGSVLALSLAQGYSIKSLGSWGALAMALLTLGSMASGFLTAAAMLATGAIVTIAEGRRIRSVAGFGAACAAIAALGWFTRVHFTALHELYARDPADWLRAFLIYAAWPLAPGALGFLLMWLPWMILLFRTLRNREARPLAPFAIGLGLWDLLQSCALAWTRSGLSGLVSSRYTEFLVWGSVANAMALAIVFTGPGLAAGRRAAALAAMAAWLALVGGNELWRSGAVYRPYFEGFRGQTLEHEWRLGTFMRKGDANIIEGVSFPRIPTYSSEQIVSTLRDPQVLALLPAPLRRDAVRDRQPSLLPSIQDGPLSHVALRVRVCGLALALVGVGLIAAALLFARPTASGMRIPGG
jgi:hypothetical protein